LAAGLFGARIIRSEWLPNYSIRRLGTNRNIFVSPAGTWAMLSDVEVEEARGVALSPVLYLKLVQNGLVLTEENAQDFLCRYKKWNSVHYRGTGLHIVVMSKHCNLQCVYCHASAIPAPASAATDLSLETAEKIVEFAFQSPPDSLHFEFQGGEPLLNFPAMQCIAQKATELGQSQGRSVSFSLVSNLTTLTREHCRFISQYKISVTTSLDGPPHIHNQQRPFVSGSGSFAGIVKALDLMREEGLPAPGFLSVVTPKSSLYLHEIIDMFVELGVKVLNFNFVQPLGHAKKGWKDIGFKENQRLQHYRELLDYVFSFWKRGEFIQERLLNIAILKIVHDVDTTFADFKNPCGLAIGQLAYGVDGTIYCCDEGRSCEGFDLGNVWRDRYEEVIQSQRVLALLTDSMPNDQICLDCAYKAFCVVCPVLKQAKQAGNSLSGNESHCAQSQFLLDYAFEKIIDEWPTVNSYLIASNLPAFQKSP